METIYPKYGQEEIWKGYMERAQKLIKENITILK